MPGRQFTARRGPSYNSTSTSSKSHPASSRKQKKRAQNAYAIAEHEVTEKPGLKRSRFGDLEQAPRKRARNGDSDDDDGDSDEGDGRQKRARSDIRDRYGKDAEYGSDSEGNEWVTGQVDDEDDDSIDSDDAFGESDEERFEGFTFRGSKADKGKRVRRPAAQQEGGLLDEFDGFDEEEELDSGEESDNFKENAVDLATMLDDNFDDDDSEDDAKAKSKKRSKSEVQPDFKDDEDEDMIDKQSDISVESEDEFEKEQNANLLKDLVAGFDTGDQTQEREAKARLRAQEALEPSAAPAGSTLDLLAELDPSLKALQGPAVKASKRSTKGIPGAVEVPLAQRQQGRLDRAAAFEKSKETLNRWVDTIKHNRRAEHLVFPLHNQDEASARNVDKLQPLTDSKPFNDLEATIQNILLESGMAPTTAEPTADDNAELALEGAGTNQPTLAEVKARNAELRRAREILFREETKARRIKKIKSKSYRRVHRKERERNLAKQQEADAEEGIFPEEDDQDRLDRLRAEERMGAKHRESKWAKAMKATGQTVWNDDARAGIQEAARRDEELRRRIHGRAVDADASAEEDSDDDSGLSDDEAKAQLRSELSGLRNEAEPTGKGSKLASMKFMQKAEAARREQNDAALAELERELDGKESSSEDEDAQRGRRKFGPQRDLNIALPSQSQQRAEFEERDESDAEDSIPQAHPQRDSDEDDIEVVTNSTKSNGADRRSTSTSTRHGQSSGRSQPRNGRLLSQEKPKAVSTAESSGVGVVGSENPWLQQGSRQKSKRTTDAADMAAEFINPDDVQPRLPAPAKQLPAKKDAASTSKKASSKQIRLLPARGAGDDDTSSDESNDETSGLQNQRGLIREAFAGDDAVGDFEAEKQLVAREERSPSPSADILPGWGSWTGTGLNKKDKRERKARNDRLQKQAKDAFAAAKGGKKVDQTRRDANLNGVIISERKATKSSKYLATTLPHPFETKAQYERSLRVPVGPEWTTKETHQASTKPRIMTGGGIIRPMEKPLL